MTDFVDRLEQQITRLTRRIASVGVMVMLFIALLTVIDIGLRWLVNASIPGFNEIIQLLMAVAIASTFPAGVTTRANLTIDILERSIAPATRQRCQLIGSWLLLLLFALLAWRVGKHALNLHERGAISLYLEIPEAPFMAVVTLMLVLATLAQMIVFLKEIKDASTPNLTNTRLFSTFFITILLLFALVLGAGYVAEFFVPTALDNAGIWVATLFIIMWLLALGFVPVAAATGLAGVLGTAIFLGNSPSLSVLGSEAADYLSNIQLAVLPLFLMMGGFAAAAGLSSDIYRLANVLLGRFRGGLAMATIGGCAGFGALTGSSIATAATIGQVSLPEMRNRGYAPGLAAGCVAAGGTLGQLVPPSTAIILYAILTEESIGKLFVAAMIPAAIAVLFYLITIRIVVGLKPESAPKTAQATPVPGELTAALRGASGVLLLFVIVLGGLYGGVFTATESAAVGAGGAFLFGLIRGKLRGQAFWDVMASTTATTAMIFLLIIGAVNFAFFVAISGLPELVTNTVQSLDVAPLIIIAVFLILYLILGSVMDPFPIMVITVPIVAPVIAGMGYDLIWWGIIMVVVVETGMITPPFGINVFVLKRIAGGDVPMPTIFKGVLPFVYADIIKLIILVLFPILTLWLPSTM